MSTGPLIQFAKYHGLGNHFVFVDNRGNKLDLNNPSLVRWLCDSRTGVGADGVAEITTCGNLSHKGCRYRYGYYLYDGTKGQFCGNGSRCSVQFAAKLGIVSPDEEFTFCGYHGENLGRLETETGLVHVKMNDVRGGIKKVDDEKFQVFTGGDNLVNFVQDLYGVDIQTEGEDRVKRFQRLEMGINIIFAIEEDDGTISVRSYETGLNGETWACGNGTIAAALVTEAKRHGFTGRKTFQRTVNVRIGKIKVTATRDGPQTFSDIYLIGPACHVYDGIIRL